MKPTKVPVWAAWANDVAKGESPLPENETPAAQKVLQLRKGLEKDQVREGMF